MSRFFTKVTSTVFVSALAFAGTAMASSQDTDPETDGHATPSESTPTGPDVHWSYSGGEGPDNWGDLSTAYELCKTGHQQSPIDIEHTQQASMAPIKTHYRAQPLHVVNNGQTIQVNFQSGSSMAVGHSEYELLQLHFHSPSENIVSGEAFPMEVHFVHRDHDGRLGVLGVFIKQGHMNYALQDIWSNMPGAGGEEFKSDVVMFNGQDLLPHGNDYYRFVGSLTTPPCSEGVQWHVMSEPIEASGEQISAFLDVIGENARPVQPIGSRLLIDSAAAGGSGH